MTETSDSQLKHITHPQVQNAFNDTVLDLQANLEGPISVNDLTKVARLETAKKLRIQRLREESKENKADAEIDELTGILNRKGFERKFRDLIQNARRQNFQMVIGVVDLDGLKEQNDILGHEKGDEYIKGAATSFSKSIRDTDIVARVGGDEFYVVLVGSNMENAEDVWLRANTQLKTRNVKVSAGFAQVDISTDENVLIARRQADEAMYAAKLHKKDGESHLVFVDPSSGDFNLYKQPDISPSQTEPMQLRPEQKDVA